MLLGVNIDHVATLRQARYALLPDSPNAEPSPMDAAHDARLGGADSITIHVRADRRHMQDRDAYEIRKHCGLPLNFEMGVTAEMTAHGCLIITREGAEYTVYWARNQDDPLILRTSVEALKRSVEGKGSTAVAAMLDCRAQAIKIDNVRA